jgi:tetratricopeptide (TPR) repeat protein
MREKQYNAAILDLNETIRLAPNNASLFRARGAAYMDKNLTEPALADENEALKLQPDDLNAAYYRGSIYLMTENWVGAVDDFTRVLAAKPGTFTDYFTTQAYLNRAKAREKLGQKAESEADIKKATELDPSLKDGLAKSPPS